MVGPIGGIKAPLTGPAASQPQGEDSAVEQEKGKRVAEEFTAIFLQLVVREMFESVNTGGGLSGEDESGSGGPFGGSSAGGDVYRGLAETAFGQTLAKNGFDSLTAQVQHAIDRSSGKTEIKK